MARDERVSEFDHAIHTEPDGRAEIEAGWDIGGNANGGYLLALAANRLRAAAARPDPLTVTAHYLSPGLAGPVQITADTIKVGKRFSTLSGSMLREGRPVLHMVGTFGDLGDSAEGFESTTAVPPDLPPMEECVPRTPHQGAVVVPLMDHLDVRLRPQDAGFADGIRSGVAEMAGWFAFADGREIDTMALLLVCDALPPAVFNLEVPPGWVPTIEYTVHVRRVPAPGPVRCVFRTRVIGGGFLEEDGEVWDSADHLVAMSRQLALLARPA